MTVLNRRSHYRKHITSNVLFELVEPDLKHRECIVKVVRARGSNQFDILLPRGNNDFNTDGFTRNSINGHNIHLAILPSKFRNLIWIKRGDFVIVSCAQNRINENSKSKISDLYKSNGIRYIITQILYTKQIKNLKKRGIWPSDPIFNLSFSKFPPEVFSGVEYINDQKKKGKKIQPNLFYGSSDSDITLKGKSYNTFDCYQTVSNDEITNDGFDSNNHYFVNQNRITWSKVEGLFSEGESDSN